MHNSAVISAWSIDAFERLTQKLFKKMSIEQLSRTEMFISAFVLFDNIYLTELYQENDAVIELNSLSENAIKFVFSEQLNHSSEMRDHISFDADLHMLSFESLAKENDLWQFQNNPDIGYALFSSEIKDKKLKGFLDSNFFTNLRLWHWCLANEMAEVTNSVSMLPISLNAVSEFAVRKKEISDMVLSRSIEYANFHNQKFAKFSEIITTPFISKIKYVPPLLLLFLERCKNCDNAILALAGLRKDYSEFKDLRHKFTNAVVSAKTISEQNDIVSEWNSSWKMLNAGEFRKPSLLQRKLSSTDISSSVISIETGGSKAIIKNIIDHLQYKKSYNLFRIFGDIEKDIGNMGTETALLHSLFGVEDIVPLIKI